MAKKKLTSMKRNVCAGLFLLQAAAVSPVSANLVSNTTTHVTHTTITNAIAAASPGHTLIVSAGTYTEAGIRVSKNLTIIGQGAANTIVQAAATPGIATDRVFKFLDGVTNTLEGLTIRHGKMMSFEGGGIKCQGADLTLNHCAVTDNETDTHGGGIHNHFAGRLTMNYCTVSGNTADLGGGGIRNDDSMVTMNHCTVSGNTAHDDGGGIFNYDTVTMNHCTISGNFADDEGGGIRNNGGTVLIGDTILAGNAAGSLGPDCSGTLTSQGYNLIEDTSDCTISGDITGNITGQDPALSPLQDNGGPTETHGLLAGSPCIDAGNPGELSGVDQRGIPRPLDGDTNGVSVADIGACEFVHPDADTDGDRMLDADELVADTDPTSSQSVLIITSLCPTNPGVQVEWTGGRQARQYLEYRSDLVSPADEWKAVFTNEPMTPVTNMFVDPNAVSDWRHYRIKAVQP